VQTDKSTLLGWYGDMELIRGFEERVQKLFSDNLVRGSTHLANGQEAVAVGVAAALQQGDQVLCTYRGHHHCLARGMSAEGAFAEILGRASGVCKGKGGSMHLTDVSKGLLGSYAIVGAHLPIAVGCAWSAHIRGTSEVTVCFFGDGTTTIGAFHEALNLASLWKLPVIFVCENNLYSEYTAIHQAVPVEHPAYDRAPAYAIEAERVDGNDILAVFEVATRAVGRARAGDGPTLIEAETYRHSGHSRADPGAYRPREEVEAWLARDPIPALRQVLLDRGASVQELDLLQQQIGTELDHALQAALAAPEPDLRELYTDAYAEGTRVS
jgi:TPP-dependent pyruvate/acetoin dehydrogenase alpha subunit